MEKPILLFLDKKSHKYSINSLLGAIESKNYLDKIKIELTQDLLTSISKAYSRYKKIIVCISFFTSEVQEIANLVKNIRSNYPKTILIAGGPHPSGDPRATLKMGFHIVVKGEGEQIILKIIDWALDNTALDEIPSIFFYQGTKLIATKKDKWINLDEYNPFSPTFKRFGPIEITRGCPFGCFFCETSYIFGKNVRHRSIENIISLVQTLFKRGMTDIRFITPNAFSYGSIDGKELNLSKLEQLLKEIRKVIKNNGRIFFGSFPSEVRPEHVTEDTVALIKRYANNDNLVIGCQSGSERILEKCRRGHSVDHVIKAVDICKKFNIIPKVDFIFGLPGEEQKDIEESIKVMKELIKKGAKIHAHTFIPLPGTPFADRKTSDISKYYPFINKALAKGKLFGEFERQKQLAENIMKNKGSYNE